MTPINIDEIEFIFKDDKSIFSEVSKKVKAENLEKGLNLDMAIVYKKGAIADVVSFLLQKYNMSEDKISKRVSKGLAFFLLLLIYPKATQLFFSDENSYQELRDYLKETNGMQYFEKNEIAKNEELKMIIQLLLKEGFLLEKDDKYYMKGYYLDSLKFTNIE